MINKCEFIGRLGQDPEMKYAPSGACFCNFTVACGEKWKDKSTGEPREHTEWVRCVASNKLAEVCAEYLRKGSLVFVSGKMNTRKWQDQSGNDRYSTEIRINEMKMLDSKPQGQQAAPKQAPQQQVRQPAQQQRAQPTYNEPPMDFSDDIPF